MKITFVSKGSLQEYKRGEQETELIVFGFNGVGEVNYEKELRGESGFFEAGALLSKRENALVVSGCITNTRGHKRKSALVAERGRLLGVSDTLHAVDGEYSSGAELRVYESKLGKIGVLVGEDLYFTEGVRSLALCGCALIVCPFGEVTGEQPALLARAHALLYGTPIALCGKGYCLLAEVDGSLAFSSPDSPARIEYAPRREYHLVERRIKGAF